jgi:hypothetical protein
MKYLPSWKVMYKPPGKRACMIGQLILEDKLAILEKFYKRFGTPRGRGRLSPTGYPVVVSLTNVA